MVDTVLLVIVPILTHGTEAVGELARQANGERDAVPAILVAAIGYALAVSNTGGSGAFAQCQVIALNASLRHEFAPSWFTVIVDTRPRAVLYGHHLCHTHCVRGAVSAELVEIVRDVITVTDACGARGEALGRVITLDTGRTLRHTPLLLLVPLVLTRTCTQRVVALVANQERGTVAAELVVAVV